MASHMEEETRLRIMIYGDFLWDRLASSYRRAFESLGHSVTPIDVRDARRDLAPWLTNRIGHRATIQSMTLRRAGTRRWNARFVETAADVRPHLVFILNGEFVMPETVTALRSGGARVFIFHADNPFPPHYAHRPETLPSALRCDCYFIWSQSLRNRLQASGVSRARYLPFGWDPEVFPHIDRSTEPRHDLVFIGGWDKRREAELTPLAERFDLKIWGPDYWGTRTASDSVLRECWQGKAAEGPEAATILADSRIVINVVREQNLPDGVIMRTFEVPGCGGFLLSTRTEGAVELFPEGEAGAYFGNIAECVQQTERYLAGSKERQAISQTAHQIVMNRHQYVHRARELLAAYEEFQTATEQTAGTR
jgi:spore maturation protein CgeB